MGMVQGRDYGIEPFASKANIVVSDHECLRAAKSDGSHDRGYLAVASLAGLRRDVVDGGRKPRSVAVKEIRR